MMCQLQERRAAAVKNFRERWIQVLQQLADLHLEKLALFAGRMMVLIVFDLIALMIFFQTTIFEVHLQISDFVVGSCWESHCLDTFFLAAAFHSSRRAR